MDAIEGFRLYLGGAEEDRLQACYPPKKTPELFERFLPYAVALDVENAWAKRFEGILDNAAVARTELVMSWSDTQLRDPETLTRFVSTTLSSSIAESIVVAAASSPPGTSGEISGSSSDSSSSGSSGSDSSGDGGGGGGGSGW
jgi:uncharacterized membrane protein YgcG